MKQPSFNGLNCGLSLFCFILLLFPFAFVKSKSSTATFDSASLSFGSDLTKTAIDINVTFRTTRNIGIREDIVVRLPRFTQSIGENSTDVIGRIYSNISFGDLIIAPSYHYEGMWVEGFNELDDASGDVLPFRTSELHIRLKRNYSLNAGVQETVTVFKENGIGAFCGFPSSEVLNVSRRLITQNVIKPPFEILTVQSEIFVYNETDPVIINEGLNGTFFNYTEYQNDTYFVDFYGGIGAGCEGDLNRCNTQGECDWCFEQCRCFEGFGSPSDLVMTGRDVQPDCSSRICPAGKAIGDIPSGASSAHALAECSNHGLCNRQTGQCQCIPPYTGAACDKLGCPNDCSGHGTCVTIAELSRIRALENPTQVTFEYGTSEAISSTAWDHDVMFTCLCDSGWDVGYFAGQTQLGQYYGPDCSLKRCPSGDDPYTAVDETNCKFISQLVTDMGVTDAERGSDSNLCHIECSNRGICESNSGTCKCFPGSWGEACENISGAGSEALDVRLHDINSSILIQGN